MPHQCTTCGRTFQDGSKEMLSGCPDCGGNKFQFMPTGAVDGDAGGTEGSRSAATAPKKAPDDAPSAPTETLETNDAPMSAVDRAAATVREWVGTRDDSDRGDTDPDRIGPAGSSRRDSSGETPTDPLPKSEDSAQASARRDVVTKAELPDGRRPNASVSDATDSEVQDNVVDDPNDEDPGLKELRDELNSQFESIRIVQPGQYELNLMELYEREEYIISLQEDGKYVIEVPDAWDDTER